MAFVFHDHDGEVKTQDYLTIIDLDPNKDRNCSDAKVVKTMEVGPSKVTGHFGHHDIGFDADGRLAYFTNPGAGTLSVLSLSNLNIVEEFAVPGTPTAILVHGGIASEY